MKLCYRESKVSSQCPRPGLEPGDERTNHEATVPPANISTVESIFKEIPET